MQLSVKDLIMNIGADSQVKPSQARQATHKLSKIKVYGCFVTISLLISDRP